MIRITSLIILMAAISAFGQASVWKAGVSAISITPDNPIWMTGYASRAHPSTGVVHDLHAKALAIEDSAGKPAVLVTMDILAIPADVAGRIADRVRDQYGIPRERIIFACSHTHGGPALADPRRVIVGARIGPDDWNVIVEYTRTFEDKVVQVVGSALKQLRPATLSYGKTSADFAVNRRLKTEKGYVIGVNPQGPVDHDVPVLVVQGADRQIMAIVFGYACHNTTCGGDIYQLHGDYAGFAQIELEKRFPGAATMFVIGCGADANPNPRGTLEIARQYGEKLAAAVSDAAKGTLRPVASPIACASDTVSIAFATPPTREALAAQSQDKDIYKKWQAQELLKVLDRDPRQLAEYPYRISAWRFGQDLTFIALSGEVVVDYDLRLKKELGADRLWVAGYCNDVFAYIPSRRVLDEGGYEADFAMIYYVQPGRFAPSVEDTIVSKVHGLLGQLNRP